MLGRYTFFHLCCILLVQAVFSGATDFNLLECEAGWRLVGKSCYQEFTSPSTYAGSLSTCRSQAGHLAVVDSQDEMEDLRTMTLVADSQRWIGLRRTEGSMDDTWDWTWQDGSLFSHTVPWLPEEPNNQDGMEYCVTMKNFQLNDESCHHNFSFICERQPKIKPRPCNNPVCESFKLNITDENVATIARNISSSLSQDSNTTDVQHDVLDVAELVHLVNESVTRIQPETMMELVSLVGDVNYTQLTSADPNDRFAPVRQTAVNSMIRSVEALSTKVDLQNTTDGRLEVINPTVAVVVLNLTTVLNNHTIDEDDDVDDGEVVGLLLEAEDGVASTNVTADRIFSLAGSAAPSYKQTDTSIQLQSSFIRQIKTEHAGKDIRIAMNIFTESNLFEHGMLEPADNVALAVPAVLNSKVVSARVTVDGWPITDLRGSHVKTVFAPLGKLGQANEASQAERRICAFWNFSGARGKGAWSDRDCSYVRTVQGRDVCVCDHLTNFAVLMRMDGDRDKLTIHDSILSVITRMGLALSVVGLSGTVICFLLIKKLRQGPPQQVLFNMALAMLCAWVVFLAGFEQTQSTAACMAVAGLLHYFILVAFMWMLVEGVVQFMMVIMVLKTAGSSFSRFMLKTAVPAWGVPLIVVIIVLCIDVSLYKGYNNCCWMKLTAFYYAFLLPVCLVLAANIVIYIMVVVKICRLPRVGNSKRNTTMLNVRASIGSFVVLGLSWTFAIFAVMETGKVFEYLFTVTTTLQGLFVFLLFTVRDASVRTYWSQKYHTAVSTLRRSRRGSSSRSSRGTDGSGSRSGRGIEDVDTPMTTYKTASSSK